MEIDEPHTWHPLTNVEGLPLTGGHGKFRRRLDGTHGVLFEIYYPAGVGSPVHHHEHDSFIYLLEGLVFGTVHGRAVRLEPGTTLLHPRGIPHTVTAEVDSRWLEFKAPPQAGWH
ncbi:cupin domain-containing protein [Pseudonocardia eucalypti]|uniref:Cupin domain-containing protein n=1 Tax=Pseudonocardia eucalypti TaxID=648755 RepID=A0ABP9QR64_9PSEU|nr:quercetin dioxygenase-like cupin family protein [Pseudonocardia eucalypti]